MIRVGTLFSGVGAPEMALRLEGIEHEVVFAAEINKYARRTYEANFDVPSDAWYKDVRDVRDDAGPVDLVVGGPPCQSFSTAGKRRGLDDPRGRMLFEFVRILRELQPRTFIFENVPGLLSMDKGGVWRLLMDLFKDAGYAVHRRYLNARHYGVPQNRRRIFAVGFLTRGMTAFTFPDRVPLKMTMGDLLEDVVPGRYATSEFGREFYKRRGDVEIDCPVAHSILAGSGGGGRNWGFRINQASGELVDEKFVLKPGPTRTALKRTSYSNNPQFNAPIARTLLETQYVKLVHSGSVNHVSDPRGTPLELVDEKYCISEAGAGSYNEKWHEQDGVVARTLRGGSGGSQTTSNMVSDPRKMGIRRLTPRECFRLQGFPDSFKIPVSDAQAYRQAGNSMCVAVVRGVLRSVMAAVV